MRGRNPWENGHDSFCKVLPYLCIPYASPSNLSHPRGHYKTKVLLLMSFSLLFSCLHSFLINKGNPFVLWNEFEVKFQKKNEWWLPGKVNNLVRQKNNEISAIFTGAWRFHSTEKCRRKKNWQQEVKMSRLILTKAKCRMIFRWKLMYVYASGTNNSFYYSH